ncbi:MAG: hypothetical protein B7Y56_08265 [Gallionellales bacterium 35-53-114]|jgi:hypothetical protein|nr:MAG: hypothetical protein B7Y56_08265 [Gallionellales bacterium 35-53-114]OYZ62621.1 MAG: hypothetical protein B7Y04_12120 [Gallionellales bacterium 24-53-125]OZB09696.1 MAG: hypothetical protein B7X61_04020 [Gallionellales bacterium 39-52-133]HQS57745.1 hypothetical protein [Gallionellaceae bacterium]HQS74198.1 hypothetical protein [Gallionellaceae bacterium]
MAINNQLSWDETSFEKALKIRLGLDLSEIEASRLMRLWENARDFLIPNILEEIKATEPDLSDHGPRHVANVLNNAYHLLHAQPSQTSKLSSNDNGYFDGLTSYEAYVLGFSIMYHDVGNIFSRKKHNQRIQEIFSEGFTQYQLDKDLRQVVSDIGGAHTGGQNANNQAIDTLCAVDVRGLWMNQQIHMQQLAAILRFADELAEGPQRASILRLRNDLPFKDGAAIAETSKIFHKYAECISPQIDRSGQRVMVRLNIDLAELDPKSQHEEVTALLETFWRRIHVLNLERRYACFYSPLLEPFKATNIQVRFYNRGRLIPVTRHHVFNDLVIPQKPTGDWKFDNCPELDSSKIWSEVIGFLEAENGTE